MYKPENLQKLRAIMKQKGIYGFYIPMSDRFQSEYPPESSARLKFLTGFTGSYAVAIVLEEKAAFFTDGRYTIQAKEQVYEELFDIYSVSLNQNTTPTMKPEDWLEANLPKGADFAIDPWIHTCEQVRKIKLAVEEAGAELICVDSNLIDEIWADRPAEPVTEAKPHPLEYAGKSSETKISEVSDLIAKEGAGILPITSADNICWLLNVRGNDIPYNPFVLSYALLYEDGHVEWFVDSHKLNSKLKEWLPECVEVKPFNEFLPRVENAIEQGAKIWLDTENSPYALKQIIDAKDVEVIEKANPIILMQAQKNYVEVQGARNAHIRDAVAVVKFLAELNSLDNIAKYDEISAEKFLYDLRIKGDLFKELSFTTISGAGGNGAIVHYHSTEQSNKPLNAGPLYLVDSGAHYLDGTTDITRTILSGSVTDEVKDRFTRVLKGHIQIAMAEFAEGTFGKEIDGRARKALQEIGLDYAHGTGHGVGSYLAVHEGPCSLSREYPLYENVIISDEPGYYKEGEYGIRIENLLRVCDTERKDNAGKRILGFETLTLVPIDKRLIAKDLLDEVEVSWLNDYHKRVRETILPLLAEGSNESEYLIKATQAI